MHDGDVSPIGHIVPHIKSDETLAQALAASGYGKPKRKHVGRGLALAQWLPLGGEGHAFVSVDERGEITVSTAMVDQGAGTYTAMRQIAAKELQVPVEQVRFQILDTSRAAADTGVGASRATRIFGNATHAAAIQVKDKLLQGASEMLGVPVDELSFSGNRIDPYYQRRAGRLQCHRRKTRRADSLRRRVQKFRQRAGSGHGSASC